MWTNGELPVAVHVRANNYVYDSNDEFERWFNADERQGSDDGPERWGDLCARMAQEGNTGPYPLNVGELLGGEG
jgi:hypothetical protein